MGPSKPTVSLGVPVYNGAEFLEKALDSLLAQTFEDFELIISDNASTDETEEICRTYAAADDRISYHRSEVNRGGAWNQNRVVELARGKYFMWAHDDDYRAPTCVAKCVEALEREESAVICYSATQYIDQEGEELDIEEKDLDLDSEKPSDRFHDLLCPPHGCLPLHGLMRTEMLKQSQLIGTYAHSDKVLLAELSLYGPFYRLSDRLFFHRTHEGNQPNSIKQYPNEYLRTALWYRSEADSSGPVFPHWDYLRAAVRAVRTAPIDSNQRVECYQHISKWMNEHRMLLINDLIKGALWPIYKRYALKEGKNNGHESSEPSEAVVAGT